MSRIVRVVSPVRWAMPGCGGDWIRVSAAWRELGIADDELHKSIVPVKANRMKGLTTIAIALS